MSEDPLLPFERLPRQDAPGGSFTAIKRPLWTEHKARLVARYLQHFVFITKHGLYIDGFAGPRRRDLPDSWAAELVLASEPRRITDFYLCDRNRRQVAALKALRARQPEVRGRAISIYAGDFNEQVDDILASERLSEKKATFCLLDQFAIECEWATLVKLARRKAVGHKIELLYFLCTGWFGRTFSATREGERLRRYWGRDDWPSLLRRKATELPALFTARFRDELGYRHADPWPIFDRKDSSRVMFHLIHATDHPAAPDLMGRAYNRVLTVPKEEQLTFDSFLADGIDPDDFAAKAG